MGREGLSGVVRLVAVLLALFAACAPARAAEVCVAFADRDTPVSLQVGGNLRWECDRGKVRLGGERAILRFTLPAGEPDPGWFMARRSHFERIEALAIGADGRVARTVGTLDDTQYALQGSRVLFPLPDLPSGADRVYVALDHPTKIAQLSQSEIVATPPGGQMATLRTLLVVSAGLGLMLFPIAFDLASWRALRRSFTLWHASMAANALVHIALMSGVATVFLDLPVTVANGLASLTFGFGVASAGMFARAYIDRQALPPILSRLLVASAIAAVCLGFYAGLFPFVLPAWQDAIYFGGFAPILAVYAVAIIVALHRGSRSGQFLAVAWLPIIAVLAVRLVTQFTPGLQPIDALPLFYAAVAFETFVTALGVIDRFVMLRRERDRAQHEAEALADLVSRDPLTGLLNRRAVKARFPQIRAQGFDAMAVIDLDHFKSVNDRFGHQTGDKVLIAAAHALRLQRDRDCIAIRLGGEEFMLLLRGRHTRQRAEALRRAITTRVVQDVPALDQPVTASMGIVEVPANGGRDMDFDELFAHADRLLYEAKAAGRNRSAYQRLTLFEGGSERQSAAA
jgi:diguanylate cyclase (GGDEF)-like protein